MTAATRDAAPLRTPNTPAEIMAYVLRLEARVDELTEKAHAAIDDAAREKLAADAAEKESFRMTELYNAQKDANRVLSERNVELVRENAGLKHDLSRAKLGVSARCLEAWRVRVPFRVVPLPHYSVALSFWRMIPLEVM